MSNIQQFDLPGPSQVAEKIIFRLLWERLPKKSFVSGLWLREFEGTPYFFNIFSHVLEKGLAKYPYFRVYAKNIVLVTPLEHDLIHNGSEEQRISYALDVEERTGGKSTADWGKIKALEEELKKEYKKWFPSTRGIMLGVKYSPQEVMIIVGALNRKFFEELQKK